MSKQPLSTSGTTLSYGNTFMDGVRDCLPTVLGYLSIGFAAGVVEKTAGLSMMEIALLSIFLYAGSAQFIVAGMLATGSGIAAIIVTVFFVNVRHLLMSAAMAPYFKHLSPVQNASLGILLTDETFSVAAAKLSGRTHGSGHWMMGLNIAAYLNWIIANLAGGYLGKWISSPEDYGLQFALPAMFIGLLVLQILARRQWTLDIIVSLIAALVAVVSGMLGFSNAGVIIAIVVAATSGLLLSRTSQDDVRRV